MESAGYGGGCDKFEYLNTDELLLILQLLSFSFLHSLGYHKEKYIEHKCRLCEFDLYE